MIKAINSSSNTYTYKNKAKKRKKVDALLDFRVVQDLQVSLAFFGNGFGTSG